MLICRYSILAFLAIYPLDSNAEGIICDYGEKLNNEHRYVEVRLDVSKEKITDLFIRGSLVPGKGGAGADLCEFNTSEKQKIYRISKFEIVTNSKWLSNGSGTTTLEIEHIVNNRSSGKNIILIERIDNSYIIKLDRALKLCNDRKIWPQEVTLEIGNSVCKVKYSN